jgi:hypothetical protein
MKSRARRRTQTAIDVVENGPLAQLNKVRVAIAEVEKASGNGASRVIVSWDDLVGAWQVQPAEVLLEPDDPKKRITRDFVSSIVTAFVRHGLTVITPPD